MAEPNPQATSSVNEDEFYVGYSDPAPRNISRFVRRATVTLAVLIVLVAGATAALQAWPGDAVWSDAPTTRAGLFIAKPYPMLLTTADHEGMPPRAILLVSPGKCGAFAQGAYCGPMDQPAKADARQALLTKLDHQMVDARGTLLARDDRLVFELADGPASISPAVGEKWREFPRQGTDILPRGPATIRGTIVDIKCYLGAMKPGEGKIHRGCAARCIAGGIPPVLVTSDANNKPAYYLLTDDKGNPFNAAAVSFAADQVQAEGQLEQLGDLNILAVKSLHRID